MAKITIIGAGGFGICLAITAYRNHHQTVVWDNAQVVVDEIIRDGDCVSLKDLAVKGRDLLEAGVERGPMVGKILDHLFDLVLLHPEKNDRELLLKEVRRL